jgi:hypothetical protein
MLTEEIKHDLKAGILDSIGSSIDELKHFQEAGWEITLDNSVTDLLDLQSSYNLRDSLLEEPFWTRKQGEEPVSKAVLEEARAYTKEVLAEVEHLSLRAFKDQLVSGTLQPVVIPTLEEAERRHAALLVKRNEKGLRNV